MSYVSTRDPTQSCPLALSLEPCRRLTSQAFISALRKYPRQSYMQLLNTVREEMQGKYSQKPQLSSSHRECTVSQQHDPADMGSGSVS